MMKKKLHYMAWLGVLATATVWSSAAFAGVADLQLSGINEVVRVSANGNGSGGRGTGSIFANVYDNSTDTRYVCVLTADHVLKSGNGGSIAFGNTPYDTNIGPFYAATHAALGQYKYIYVDGDPIPHKPDLAVMAVPVPDEPFFQNLQPFALVTPSANDHDVTLRGFGLTGPLTDILTPAGGERYAYVEDLLSYGTQRFSNNTIEDFELRDDGKYRDVSELFDLSVPPAGVIGEGVGMRGDSGGPLLNYDAVPSLLANNTIVPGFTRTIEGVFTRAVTDEDTIQGIIPIRDGNGNIISFQMATRFIVDFNNVYGGVALLPEYIDWAYSECLNNVPEPGSLLLLAVGLSVVVSRRRRR